MAVVDAAEVVAEGEEAVTAAVEEVAMAVVVSASLDLSSRAVRPDLSRSC